MAPPGGGVVKLRRRRLVTSVDSRLENYDAIPELIIAYVVQRNVLNFNMIIFSRWFIEIFKLLTYLPIDYMNLDIIIERLRILRRY